VTRCRRGFAAGAVLWLLDAAFGFSQTAAVRIVLDPPPNAAGWNNTAVTASPVCERPFKCSDPMLFDQDGGGQRAVRTAVDDGGRAIQATAAVNIDRRPPRLDIVSVEATARRDAAIITARASDDGSGLAEWRCGSRAAAVTGDTIKCVLLLRPGINDLPVTISDRAGNTASLVVRFPRATDDLTPEIVPGSMTIGVGEMRPVELRDLSGERLKGASWSLDDSYVATFDDVAGLLTGRNAGTTAINAVLNGQTLRATVTVVARNTVLPPGTSLWEMARHPGVTPVAVIQLQRGASADPDLMFVEADDGGTFTRLRAVSAIGFLNWNEYAAIGQGERLHDWMADRRGGALLWGGDSARSAIVNAGSEKLGRLWRYECVSPADGAWAMNAEGTLFVVETPPTRHTYITALDSTNGAVKFRVPVPHAFDRPPASGPALIDENDEAVVQFATVDDIAGGPRTVRVALLRISDEGTSHVTPVAEFSEEPSTRVEPSIVRPYDFGGKYLLFMKVHYANGRSVNRVVRMAQDERAQYELPAIGEYVRGEDSAYSSDGQTLVAFDPLAGTVKWTRNPPPGGRFELDFAIAGGGVMVTVVGGTASGKYKYDTDGVATLASAMTIATPIR